MALEASRWREARTQSRVCDNPLVAMSGVKVAGLASRGTASLAATDLEVRAVEASERDAPPAATDSAPRDSIARACALAAPPPRFLGMTLFSTCKVALTSLPAAHVHALRKLFLKLSDKKAYSIGFIAELL